MTWKWKPPFEPSAVDLQTLAFNIATFTGRTRMAPRRGGNVEIQYRDGTLWTPKDYDEHEIELAMWVVGAEADGSIPDVPRLEFWRNVKKLQRLFRTDVSMGELIYTHPTEEIEVRALAEVADQVDFESMAGATRAGFFVRFTLPEVWFRPTVPNSLEDPNDDPDPDPWDGYTLRSHEDEWTVTVESDVIVKDPIIKIRDPGGGGPSNIRIYSKVWNDTFHWIQYSGVLADGEEIIIDTKRWRATSGVTRVTGNVQWSGQPQFFWLVPGDNEVEIEVTDGPVEIAIEARGAFW